MRNKILGGAVLLIATFSISETRATSCVRLPSCEQLGYTMTKADCGEVPVLRCPFALSDDNQVFCRKGTGLEQVVALGAILYGDGTVTTEILSGTNAPTPIGIVFDVENRLAVALTDVKIDGSEGNQVMEWSVTPYDVPNLENCTMSSGIDSTVISCGTDGRVNTDKILACGSNCQYTPAVVSCNSYQPIGCMEDFCKKTKWFLPSMRDLNNIYQQKAMINATLSSLGKSSLLNNSSYWSSNENDTYNAWSLRMNNGYRNNSTKNSVNDANHLSVRPVVAF